MTVGEPNEDATEAIEEENAKALEDEMATGDDLGEQ